VNAFFFVSLLTMYVFQGVKAMVSIGGWTGSMYFSSAVATPENRTTFVGAVTKLANTYKLDGIDFERVPFFAFLLHLCL
jgi:GH18 family chitinase